ncbi:MAG: glycosyltransferase family 39 protein [Anaerolineae bacterium]|nr:glycosyltransferase family 39 protein [Anaerolineae bacterium]
MDQDYEPKAESWLTLERAVYGVLLLAAAWLRFLHLGVRPLGPEEAAQAWAAWRLTQGLEVIGSGHSPLLLSLQYLTFLITGAGDALARFWPALVGTGMVLLPYALRQRLGRVGALAASFVLAFSPTMVFFSRHSSGHIFVAAGALALFVALLNWLDGRERWLVFAAAAAGAMLASGPEAWLMILVFIGLVWALKASQSAFPIPQSAIRNALLAFGLTFGLGSTALLLHWRGLGLAADLLPAWLSSFLPRAGGYPWYWPALRLLLDEPLALFAGLAGIAWGLRRGDHPHPSLSLSGEGLGRGLAVWAGVALLATTLAGGRQPGDLLLVVVPLALLAGQALPPLAETSKLKAQSSKPQRAGQRTEGDFEFEVWGWKFEVGLLLLVMLVLLVTLAIWLATYSRTYMGQVLWVALAPAGLLLVIIVLYGFWSGWAVTARAAGVAALLVLVLFSLSLAWGLSLDFNPARRGAVLRDMGAYGMRSLPATLEILSSQRANDPHELAVDVVTAGEDDRLTPLLGWALRDFVRLRWVEKGVTADAAAVVVAPERLELPLGEGYAGQDFPLIARWTPQGLSGKPLWRWLLYREATAAPPMESVVLWVRRS